MLSIVVICQCGSWQPVVARKGVKLEGDGAVLQLRGLMKCKQQTLRMNHELPG